MSRSTQARRLKSQFMAIRHAVLLIADIIGGYTRYLTSSAGLRRWIPTPSVAPSAAGELS